VPAQAGINIEVVEALTALGYSTAEARRAVNDLDGSPDLTVEDRIRRALQRIGGG
jgi:Holliday junction resolvasome RuvABC DNA-binding subunit